MSNEAPARFIVCSKCGQKMRVAPNATATVFKCVKCGALVEYKQQAEPAPEQQPEKTADLIDPFTKTLVAAKLVTVDHVIDALAHKKVHGGKVYEILLSLEHLNKDAFHSFLSKQSGIAGISLAHFTLDRALTSIIPQEMVMHHLALPITQLGKLLTVAMVNPLDMEAINEIQQSSGLKVKPMLCTYNDFFEVVQKYYRLPDATTNTTSLELLGLGNQEKAEEAKTAEPKMTGRESGAEAPDGQDQAPEQKPAPVEPAAGKAVEKLFAEKILSQIDSLEKLECPVRQTGQITSLLGKGRDGLRQIVGILGGNPPLTATLLGAVNTSAYGLGGSVDNLPVAIALMGEQGINLLATNARQMNQMLEKHLSLLFRHSRLAGDVAAFLAAECGRTIHNVAQTAAMLYPLGSFLLAQLEPDEYRKIDRRLYGLGRLQAERQVFGVGHDEVGGRLLAKWGIPPVIVHSIRSYASPADAADYSDVASLVCIATLCVNCEGEFQKDAVAQAMPLISNFGLTASTIQQIVEKVSEF